MATIEAAYRDLWRSIKSTIPFNPETAICKEWRNRYQEWGAPITTEKPLDDGGVYQCFTHAVVRWTPERGIEVVVGE
jgi:hypothetical protein